MDQYKLEMEGKRLKQQTKQHTWITDKLTSMKNFKR